MYSKDAEQIREILNEIYNNELYEQETISVHDISSEQDPKANDAEYYKESLNSMVESNTIDNVNGDPINIGTIKNLVGMINRVFYSKKRSGDKIDYDNETFKADPALFLLPNNPLFTDVLLDNINELRKQQFIIGWWRHNYINFFENSIKNNDELNNEENKKLNKFLKLTPYDLKYYMTNDPEYMSNMYSYFNWNVLSANVIEEILNSDKLKENYIGCLSAWYDKGNINKYDNSKPLVSVIEMIFSHSNEIKSIKSNVKLLKSVHDKIQNFYWGSTTYLELFQIIKNIF